MAKYSEVIEGLQIFLAIEGDKHGICAEHDIIYGGEDEILTEDQRIRLDELGWHLDSEINCWARFV